ncbi:major facilitator family transporter [Acidithiobacillus sp. GGI-221]|nr:major facilitator family transporter [Acidithiobacillus sp. GGI-221]
MVSIGVISLIAAVLFVRSLPDSLHFSPQHVSWNGRVQQIRMLFKDSGLPWLFAEGFFLMGIFVTFYNYLTYRLVTSPYDFSQAQVGLIFSVYGVGIFSSPVMGHIAGWVGRRKVLWMAFALVITGVLLSFAGAVWAIMLGTILLTFGFLEDIPLSAVGWVGERMEPRRRQHHCISFLLSGFGGTGKFRRIFLFWLGLGWCGRAADFSGSIWTAHRLETACAAASDFNIVNNCRRSGEWSLQR